MPLRKKSFSIGLPKISKARTRRIGGTRKKRVAAVGVSMQSRRAMAEDALAADMTGRRKSRQYQIM